MCRLFFAHLKKSDVQSALEKFQSLNVAGKFKPAELTDMIERLQYCDANLSLVDEFSLANCPVDPDRVNDILMLRNFSSLLTRSDRRYAVPELFVNLKAAPIAALLSEAASSSRRLAIYSWFAVKCPEFAAVDGIDQIRAELTEFVDQCLLSHQKTSMSKRKIKPGWV